MKFTDKDLLKAMGLEVGNFILIKGKQWEVTKTVKGLKIWSDDYMKYEDLSNLIGLEFEKIEQKIWTVDMARESTDSEYMYYIYKQNEVGYIFGNPEYHMADIKNKIFFTKEKYAEEYLEELKKFNEEYKKNNI